MAEPVLPREPREPIGAGNRPSPDMPSPIQADHATHDLELIAAHAAGDLDPAESSRAAGMLAACAECRTLAADLAALAAATRALPPVARGRDFQLSVETAERLRGTSPFRRIMDGLLAPRGFGRPLAGALMTLGLAGLMVAAMPSWLAGTGSIFTTNGERDAAAPMSGGATGVQSSAPEYAAGSPGAQDGTQKDAITGSATPAASPAPAMQPEPAASGSPGPGDAVAPPQTAVDGTMGPETNAGSTGAPGSTPAQDRSAGGLETHQGGDLTTLAIGSVVLLLAGAGLLVVRRLVRRGHDRLAG